MYLPERKGLDKASVAVDGKPGIVEIVARPSIGEHHNGRVLRVYTEIKGSGVENDGLVSISW